MLQLYNFEMKIIEKIKKQRYKGNQESQTKTETVKQL